MNLKEKYTDNKPLVINKKVTHKELWDSFKINFKNCDNGTCLNKKTNGLRGICFGVINLICFGGVISGVPTLTYISRSLTNTHQDDLTLSMVLSINIGIVLILLLMMLSYRRIYKQ